MTKRKGLNPPRVNDTRISDGLRNRETYALVKEHESAPFLYIRRAENSHSPKFVWTKLRLSLQLESGMQQLDAHLGDSPATDLGRAKDEFRKVLQILPGKTRDTLPIQKSEGRCEKLVPINRRTERREAKREVKAEASAKVTDSIEAELLQRLRQGIYGQLHGSHHTHEVAKPVTISPKEVELLQLEKIYRQVGCPDQDSASLTKRQKRKATRVLATCSRQLELEYEQEMV